MEVGWTDIPLQEFGVGLGIHVASCLKVQKSEQLRAVYEISVHAHRQSIGRIDVKGLRFGSAAEALLAGAKGAGLSSGRAYADEVPAVGYLRWEILPKSASFLQGPGREGVPHEARHRRRRRTSAVVKHLAGHAYALALKDPSALAYSNAGSILSALLLGSAFRKKHARG